MKVLKNLIFASVIAILSIVMASTVMAASKESNTSKSSDYYAGYCDEEGSLLFKIRGFYAATDAKVKNLPAATNLGAAKPSRLTQSGYGFDSAMTIFVTDNIAAEVSLGVGYYKTKASALITAINAYGTQGSNIGKRNQIFMVPASMTAQYHIAPFGGIRPYVGGGYSGTYMYTRSKAIKVNSGHGPVIQAGVDFISKDDTLFTIDVRQYLLKSKVMFKKGFLQSPSDVSSKVTWNPVVISAGFGFKF